jgi:protease IV
MSNEQNSDFDIPPVPPQQEQQTTQQAQQQMPPIYIQLPPQEKNKKSYWWIPASLAIGCLPWFLVFILTMALAMSGVSREPISGNHVALIKISGVITGGSSDLGMFGGESGGSETIIKQLESARKNRSAKAIVLRINSPGGSAAGSEEVYKEIMLIRKEGKPVYTSMGDVAASGGYYIASACDKIYADASTLTGSIGVIFETPDVTQLFKKIGLGSNVIKSGKFKDIGNPARPMTDEERILMKGLIMDTYGEFVKSVSEGRNMPIAEVKAIADGRVFSGNQAKKLKLIDEIGGLNDTIKAAAIDGGISGEPKVRNYTSNSIFNAFLGDVDSETISKLGTKMIKDALESDSNLSGLK